MSADNNSKDKKSLHFIEQIIEDNLANGLHGGRVLTRFPPEPNGYLHIGHAKSICLNFGVAQKYGGGTNLRFDDTNPVTEDTEYVDSIRNDVRWLGFDWVNEFYASDYFEQIYDFAIKLIELGYAYVDDSSAEEIAAQKGSPTVPGTPNVYRSRSVEENLDLFKRMRNGEFKDGAKVLRAKIDLASPNMHFRDPLLYRIKHAHHHRTGDAWCIYPMYDFAHGQSDSIEQITHSICTLEFENHRPLYEWFIKTLEIFPSKQYEFARLNLTYTIMSKRRLLRLVNEGYVTGWDDPRMPTISGLRRRGYTSASIRNFADRIGIARREHVIDVSLLEFCIREDLNENAPRFMAVLDPIKVIISNYDEGKVEWMPIENNPEKPETGTRDVPFTRELFIEASDFMEDPPKKYFRLSPGGMVRLKGGFIIECQSVEKNEDGSIKALHCTYFPESRSGSDESGIKVKGVIHWVSASHVVPIEVRLYDRLFNDPTPDGHADKDFVEFIHEDSLTVLPTAYGEINLKDAKVGDTYQFLRNGYFCVDPDSTNEKWVFNRTVTLKETWAK